MPPEASSYGHIWVEDSGRPWKRVARGFLSLPASFFPCRKLMIPAIIVAASILAGGCSSAARVADVEPNIRADSLSAEEDIADDVEEGESEIPEPEIVKPNPPVTAYRPDLEANPAIDRRKVLADIMILMGKPYKKRGSGKTGFDCSGFTLKIFNDALGVILPRSSKDQFKLGTKVDRDSLKFGDLVFFKTRRRIPSHVGIYVGDGLFAHASLSLGVTVSLLASTYYERRYVGARRIVQ